MAMIRAAVPADAADIAQVHLLARRARMPYLPQVHTDDEVRTYFADTVLVTDLVLVAEVDGEIVGFAAVAGDSLEHLYVRPGHLRTGVGSALLDRVKELRPDGLRLFVFQRNEEARAFYRRHDFVPSSFHSGAENEEHEPDLIMRWSGAGARA